MPSSFGAQLRAWRERAGFSQEALAERAGLGVATLAALEHDQRQRPHPHTLTTLAEALGLAPAERAALLQAAPGRAAAEADLPEHAAAASAPAAGSVDEPAAGLGDWLPRSNVPAPRSALVGRERELKLLRELVAGTRLVTITGFGGSGKTSLGLHAAHELRTTFSEHVWVVELAPMADPALVLNTIVGVLGVREDEAGSALAAISALLQDRSALLVLDNCEHLIDACAHIAGQLLDACVGLRLLATSREPLLIPGERQLRLGPLAAPDSCEPASVDEVAGYPAVKLFVERAHGADATFVLSADNSCSVAQVCARLSGLPLAIELAAARVAVLGLDQLAKRLEDGLRVLSGGSRVAPTRQQTLGATLDWSYALLDESERAVFRQLAVFAGGWDLEAAEAVCAMDDVAHTGVLDQLGRLVDKSLVVTETFAGTARYRLLEPVRQYAWQRLEAERDLARVTKRHADYYGGLAQRASPELRAANQVAWLRRLDRERDNLRAALGRAADQDDSQTVLRIGVALVGFWEVRGYTAEGRRWLETGLTKATPHAGSDQLRLRAQLGIGQLAFWQADLVAAAAAFEQALVLGREHDDTPGVAAALTGLGAVRVAELRFAEAEAPLAEGLRLHELTGDTPGAAWALFHLGRAAANASELAGNPRDGFQRACALLETSLAHYRALGDVRLGATAGLLLGAALVHAGQWQRAAALLLESLAGLEAVGDRAYLLSALVALARVAAIIGQPVCAARLLGAAEALHARVGANRRGAHRSQACDRADAPRGVKHRWCPRASRAHQTRRALALADARAGERWPATSTLRTGGRGTSRSSSLRSLSRCLTSIDAAGSAGEPCCARWGLVGWCWQGRHWPLRPDGSPRRLTTFSLNCARLRLRQGGDQPTATIIDNGIASHGIDGSNSVHHHRNHRTRRAGFQLYEITVMRNC
ncbi:MAG: helix-turn-helix domain-containing protein [Chloroflexi bacterium]|nr:helix-turn-helix domain-containing protein [Chloroflexota bacterium]